MSEHHSYQSTFSMTPEAHRAWRQGYEQGYNEGYAQKALEGAREAISETLPPGPTPPPKSRFDARRELNGEDPVELDGGW